MVDVFLGPGLPNPSDVPLEGSPPSLVGAWLTQDPPPLRRSAYGLLFAALIASGSSWVFAPTGETVTLDKWYTQDPTPVRKAGFAAAEQQAFTIDPFALTQPETTSVDRYYIQWPDPTRRPPSRVSGFPVESDVLFVPPPAYGWFAPWADQSRPKSLPRALYPSYFPDPAPVGGEIITLDKWYQQDGPPVRKLGFRAALQLAFTIDPFALTQPETTSVDRWYQQWLDPTRAKISLPRGDYPSTFQTIEPTGTFVPPDRWYQQWPDPTRLKASLPRADYPSFILGIEPTMITVPADRWYQQWLDPTRPKAWLARGAMPFLAFVADPGGNFVPPDRWYAQWPDPTRRKVALASGALPSYFPDPAPVTELVTLDKWYRQPSEPLRLRKGLLTALQMAFTVDPFALTQPETTSVDRWYKQWVDPVRRPAPFIARLPFGCEVLFTPVVVATSYGWYEQWVDPVRRPKSRSELLGTIAAGYPPIIPTMANWFAPLSEPVRRKYRGYALLPASNDAWIIQNIPPPPHPPIPPVPVSGAEGGGGLYAPFSLDPRKKGGPARTNYPRHKRPKGFPKPKGW